MSNYVMLECRLLFLQEYHFHLRTPIPLVELNSVMARDLRVGRFVTLSRRLGCREKEEEVSDSRFLSRKKLATRRPGSHRRTKKDIGILQPTISERERGYRALSEEDVHSSRSENVERRREAMRLLASGIVWAESKKQEGVWEEHRVQTYGKQTTNR